MLKFIGFCVKATLFTALVLVLGQTIEWDGKTISEHVRITLRSSEHSELMSAIRVWAKRVTSDAQKGIQKKPTSPLGAEHASDSEVIPVSEKQKLRALMRELNTSRKAD